MPKKIRFESFRYRLMCAAKEASAHAIDPGMPAWETFINSLVVRYGAGEAVVTWPDAAAPPLRYSLDEPKLFCRGDDRERLLRQRAAGSAAGADPVKADNDAYFRRVAASLAAAAGYRLDDGAPTAEPRLSMERAFHDAWAKTENPETIDVRACNEVCTAPEMRYITARLGDLRGKRLLDIGCGLGEASVYFALRGAEVTASDLSEGMLAATRRLAEINGVKVRPHLASAEDMGLGDEKFDVIYAGNLLHHVDIDKTLGRIKRHLAPGGVLCTWDPIAYNPVINVYRALAKDVRTPDEHPLEWKDIKGFRKHFGGVETKYFWLTTLAIFLIMALIQRRDPNKVRFWKAVVQEGDKWAWLYEPLAKIDRFLLAVCPPLRLICWNVVVICRNR